MIMRKQSLLIYVAISLIMMVLFSACQKKDTPPTPKSPPSQVLGLTAFGRDQADSLVWAANSSDQGVTSYKIYAGTSATGLVLLTTTTTNKFVRTGLTNGTTYYYQVSAVNSAGEGNKSDVVSSTPTPPLNKQISMSIPAALPGAMKVLPWRYYDPTSKHYGNPYVGTDTFKTVYQARVIDGFDSLFSKKIQDNGLKLPTGLVILQDLRLDKITGYATAEIWKVEKVLPRIVDYSIGIVGQGNFTLYGVADTIPMAVELNGDILKGKTPREIIESVHWVVQGTRGPSAENPGRPSLYSKLIAPDDFAVNTTASVFDKKTPTIYTLNGKWYIVFPAAGSKNGSSQATTTGNTDYTVRILLKDGTKLERTVFSFE